VRCPNGHTGQCFFQKHVSDIPRAHVHGVMVRERGEKEPEEYLAIRDRPGLITLVQMGALEIHPWPAREDHLERPDRLIFDLDPGPGVAWNAVIAAAVEVRERLVGCGLRSWVKTSGGKGLHVVAPLERRANWDVLRAFAQAVATGMAREAPGRFVAVMTKSRRAGRIFVDYLRNTRGATAVAAYSTRARPGAPVSAPLTWAELERDQPAADAFTVRNVPARLRRMRRDPWAGFLAARQSLTAEALRRTGAAETTVKPISRARQGPRRQSGA
jgi:bifunctional non-homologous end joining protein LigD